jgi:hypothetical protein
MTLGCVVGVLAELSFEISRDVTQKGGQQKVKPGSQVVAQSTKNISEHTPNVHQQPKTNWLEMSQ